MADLPGIQVELMVELGDFVRSALREDRVDLVISTILPTDTREFDVELITNDTVVVVGASDNPLCAGPVTIEPLLGRKWVLSSPSASTRRLARLGVRRPKSPAATGPGRHRSRPPQVQIESNRLS